MLDKMVFISQVKSCRATQRGKITTVVDAYMVETSRASDHEVVAAYRNFQRALHAADEREFTTLRETL